MAQVKVADLGGGEFGAPDLVGGDGAKWEQQGGERGERGERGRADAAAGGEENAEGNHCVGGG